MVTKSDFDLSLEAEGDPGYFENRDQNNLRIIDHYRYLVGTPFTDSLCLELTGKLGRPVRGYGNRTIQLNYNPCRLNLDMDEHDVITRLFFA